MTAKPVPEHISDERLAEMLALLDGKLPLRRTDNPDYAEIDGANWLQAMCIAPDALMLLNDVPSLLIELQHRREAEAEAIERCAKVADAYSDIWKRGRNPEDAPEARVGAGREIAEAIRALAASPSSPASGVRVKALEWVKHPATELWRADTMLGRYQVYAVVSQISWAFDAYDGITRTSGDAASADEAKAAAQADYDARLLSALGEHP